MKTWQKAMFIIVLISFIVASVTISFVSMARAPFEYEYQTAAENPAAVDGWVLFCFNGNTSTTEVYIDFVRDENGKNGEWNVPDADFTQAKVYNITSDGNEYICDVTVTDKKISLDIKAGQAVAIKST